MTGNELLVQLNTLSDSDRTLPVVIQDAPAGFSSLIEGFYTTDAVICLQRDPKQDMQNVTE